MTSSNPKPFVYFVHLERTPTRPARIKIGYSRDAAGTLKRVDDVNGGRLYCAMRVTGSHDEKAIHNYFDRFRYVDGRGQETFRLDDDDTELVRYLEWLTEQPWVACSRLEVQSPFAVYVVDDMLPAGNWDRRSRHDRAVERGDEQLELFADTTFDPLQAPFSAERRTSLAAANDNEYYTPCLYLDLARQVLGHIDLDPASSQLANRNVKAARIYTANDDGLAARNPWYGNVWLNPPYNGLQTPFLQRLKDEYAAGNVHEAIACLNGYSYDTKWWNDLDLFTQLCCFPRSRIRFTGGSQQLRSDDHPEGPTGAPSNGSVFVYWGPNPDRFTKVFGTVGNVLQRINDTPTETAGVL